MPRASMIVRRLLGATVAALLVALLGTAASVWRTARSDDRRHSDVIVVLGASQFDGRASAVLRARLDHARTLYDDGVAPVVVTVGGGAPGDRFTEGEVGATYLTERHVDAVAVGEGRDTLQSLQALDRAMATRGWRTAVLVTDPWHSLRACRMARDLGIDAVTSPTRSGPSVHTRATEVRYIARETAAYLYYRVAGAGGTGSGPPAV